MSTGLEQLTKEMHLRDFDFDELLDTIGAEAASYGRPRPPSVRAIREEIRRRFTVAAECPNLGGWRGHLDGKSAADCP
jgi:hypothetical protein